MSSEANHVPFGEGRGVAGFEMLTYGNRQATSGISPNTATQTQQGTTYKEGRKKSKGKVQKIIFSALLMVTLSLATAATALAIVHWFAIAGCECATEPGAMEELIQGQIQQLNNTSASASEEIMVLQIEMNRFRNFFYELQQNQTVIEELQRQIQQIQ